MGRDFNRSRDFARVASALSEDFSPYLDACRGDQKKAIILYEQNVQLSAAFYAPLHILELTFRNACRRELKALFGAGWATDSTLLLCLDDYLRRQISKKHLDFGFWVGLLKGDLAPHLWDRGLHKAFPHFRAISGKSLTRKPVAQRFKIIRDFRNEVFHHEPIVFRRNLMHDYVFLREAASWLSPDVANWMDMLSEELRSLLEVLSAPGT